MPAVAVPMPAVARAPALQWVSTPAQRWMSGWACRPMAWHMAASWRWMAWASSSSASQAAWSAKPRAAASARSTAQARFTAVGRQDLRYAAFLARAEAKSPAPCPGWRRHSCAASTMPYAAATPMAGAPRTASRRMASNTSAVEPHST